jgi:hypothetical protein
MITGQFRAISADVENICLKPSFFFVSAFATNIIYFQKADTKSQHLTLSPERVLIDFFEKGVGSGERVLH